MAEKIDTGFLFGVVVYKNVVDDVSIYYTTRVLYT